ncbi:MAG TPA: GNAT family N-acetyltransferase [Bryobacteraceae bacterium]|jgi:GNAT superfamily N-acetyltransferase|nr:GNAT family N-acetyltransferase [Bryobacteraceae bacterium]
MPEIALNDLLIREITAGDATAAAGLSEELGYPVSPDTMRQRIEFLNRSGGHVVYIACLAGDVVGWIDVRETHHLQVEPCAEIGGLVVAGGARGGGVGRCLIERAEHWAMQRGLERVIVRSRLEREAAHRFYLRQGYARTKTSAVFTKNLG